jgi:hypothetical protein
MKIPAVSTTSKQGQQSRQGIRRLWVLAALGVGLLVPLLTSAPISHAAGNSDAAHACQQGGYLTLTGRDSSGQPVTFANEGECVSFVAHGGFIPGVTACMVTSTTGCLTFNNATLPELSGSDPGYTITLTGSTSFVDTCPSGTCDYVSSSNFNLPNALATGGGTYVEQDSTGTVTHQGIYRIAGTAGSYEGLGGVVYVDPNRSLVSSCAAATGERLVLLVATLIDSSPGATPQLAVIEGATGVLPSTPPLPFAGVGTTSDTFLGTVSSSAMSLTC